jgi:hypothetical protein
MDERAAVTDLGKLPAVPGLELAGLGERTLVAGDYETGWRLYEGRLAWKYSRTAAYRGTLEDLRAKVVLVRGEGGWGDNLLFLRYVALLLPHCARIILEPPPGLRSLYQLYFPPGQLVFRQPTVESVGEPTHISIMSLPLLLGPVIGWVPPGPLPVPSGLVPSRRSGIGICLDASPPRLDARFTGREREAIWAQIGYRRRIRVPPRELGDALAAAFGPFTDLRHAALGFCSWLETATVMSKLELVISIDTGTAHLAATLGCETSVRGTLTLARAGGGTRTGTQTTSACFNNPRLATGKRCSAKSGPRYARDPATEIRRCGSDS